MQYSLIVDNIRYRIVKFKENLIFTFLKPNFKNTKNLLFHQGLFAPAFELLIASGALILDQIGKSAF